MTEFVNEAHNGKEVLNSVEGELETPLKMKNDRKHRCSECPYSTDTKNRFESHWRTHSGERPYQCVRCEKAFSEKCTLKKHLLIHSGDRLFVCGACGMEFSRSDNLTRHHHRRHTGNNKRSRNTLGGKAECFKSRTCSENPSQSSLGDGDQKMSSNGGKYRCALCTYSTAHGGDFNKHCRSHTGEKPFSCDQCEKTFVGKGDLLRHLRCHSGDHPYTCSTCGKGYKRSDALRKHERSHAMMKPVQDPLCGKVDARDGSPSAVGPSSSPKSSVGRNRPKTHQSDGKHRCPDCTFSTNCRGKLCIHQRIHSGEKPFGCNKCEKTFARNSDLSRHLHTHIGDHLFNCGTCGKRLRRKDNFRKHEKSHAGERPSPDPVEKADANERVSSSPTCCTLEGDRQKPLHPKRQNRTVLRCPECTYSSDRRRRFDDHLQTHLFEKPFMCDQCGKAFAKKCLLHRHLRTHLGDVHPFVCGTCDKLFERMDDLLQHEELHLEDPFGIKGSSHN